MRIRQFLTPEADKEDTLLINKDRKYRALNQVFEIAQKNSSRPMPGRPFSILMFLPILSGQSIGELCRIWASFLYQSVYWKENFVMMTLSPFSEHQRTTMPLVEQIKRGIVFRDDHPGRDLKDLIEEVERESLKIGKGLLLLSGDVAKMGISLPCVDVVFLMSADSDADDIIQKMYRALTDNPPTKKDGFIVDLDLKRIVTAVFEYDLTKDSMRLNLTEAPSVEERLIKISNLCNWGYDSFIEDNAGMNFNDVMNIIKERVLNGIQESVFRLTDETKIKREQKEFIESNTSLKTKIIDALLDTKFDKVKKPTREQLMARGLGVPEESNNAESSNTETESNEETTSGSNTNTSSSNEEAFLDPRFMNQLYQKIYNITKTFVNALVIKSAEPWTKSMNIVALLEKFKADKATAGAVVTCDCESNENCKKKHDNLYASAFCELKSYAMKQRGESDTYNYDEATHKKIMSSIEEIFESAPNIIEWNIYIEKLLLELKQSGGGKKKRYGFTRKDGHNHRKTLQQSTRRHR